MLGLIVATILAASPPEAADPSNDVTGATAQHISLLNPKMAARQAERVGGLIDYWADHYDVDPHLMVAIIEHESGFKSGIRACWNVIRKGIEVTTCDHGLAQINEVWIDKWMLDVDKLTNDESYNIYVQARVLAWLKRYYGHEENWYGRYNSGIPSKKAAYLAKIEPLLATRVLVVTAQ